MSIPVEPVPSARPAPANLRLGRLVPLGIIALVSLAVIGVGWFEGLSPVVLIERRVAVDAFVSEHWIAALAAFAGVYAIAVALSLPGGALLTVCGGVIFGGLAGGLAALIGATAGATAIFLIAKSALGDWLVHRAGRRTEVLAAGFCADAFNYLLCVRLATYVTATVIGIIPATFAFAFFGAGLDSAVAAQAAAYRACLADGGANCRLELDPATAATPQLIAALVTLGVLALIPVAVRRFKAAHARPELASHPSKTPSACPKSSRPTSA